MKALLYTLTLLLFSLGAGASEQGAGEAVPVSHIDIGALSAVIDPVPVNGADRALMVAVLSTWLDVPCGLPGAPCPSGSGWATSALHAIRAPPSGTVFLWIG